MSPPGDQRKKSSFPKGTPLEKNHSSSTPPPKFHCEVCNRDFSRRDNLRTHQRVHSGERPFNCKYCSQSFRWIGGLRAHEANHMRHGHEIGNASPYVKGRPRQFGPESARENSTAGQEVHVAPRNRPLASASRDARARQKEQGGNVVRSGSRRGNDGQKQEAQSPSRRKNQGASSNRHVLVTDQDPELDELSQGPWHGVLDDDSPRKH